MKTMKTVVAAGAALLLSFGALAQTSATTEEAKAVMHQSMVDYGWAHAFDRPVLEDPNSEVPESTWRNEARIAAYYSFHRALRDHEAGVRSAPIAVDSTETAKEEAARVRREKELDTYVAHMQASPAARLAHEAALSDSAVAAK
jgi:hypothetical protein